MGQVHSQDEMKRRQRVLDALAVAASTLRLNTNDLREAHDVLVTQLAQEKRMTASQTERIVQLNELAESQKTTIETQAADLGVLNTEAVNARMEIERLRIALEKLTIDCGGAA